LHVFSYIIGNIFKSALSHMGPYDYV